MEGREGIECGVGKEDRPLHSYGQLIDHPGEGLFDDVDVWGSRRPVSNINKLIGLPRWTFVILCFVSGALLTPQELVTHLLNCTSPCWTPEGTGEQTSH